MIRRYPFQAMKKNKIRGRNGAEGGAVGREFSKGKSGRACRRRCVHKLPSWMLCVSERWACCLCRSRGSPRVTPHQEQAYNSFPAWASGKCTWSTCPAAVPMAGTRVTLRAVGLPHRFTGVPSLRRVSLQGQRTSPTWGAPGAWLPGAQGRGCGLCSRGSGFESCSALS